MIRPSWTAASLALNARHWPERYRQAVSELGRLSRRARIVCSDVVRVVAIEQVLAADKDYPAAIWYRPDVGWRVLAEIVSCRKFCARLFRESRRRKRSNHGEE